MTAGNPVARIFARPARVLAILGGWWLVGLSFVTVGEILARKLFGVSLQGVDEIGAYTLAVFSTFAFAWALVTESAALAVVAALPIAALHGRLSVRMLHACFLATASLTAMSLLILAAAFYLNVVMGLLGVTPALGAFVTGLGVGPLELILALRVFHLLLGIVFETLPMLVGTVPVVFPVVVAAGIDPVRFGVFVVLMGGISLLSPPVGMSLYVIRAVRREGTIAQVFQGTVPFFPASARPRPRGKGEQAAAGRRHAVPLPELLPACPARRHTKPRGRVRRPAAPWPGPPAPPIWGRGGGGVAPRGEPHRGGRRCRAEGQGPCAASLSSSTRVPAA